MLEQIIWSILLYNLSIAPPHTRSILINIYWLLTHKALQLCVQRRVPTKPMGPWKKTGSTLGDNHLFGCQREKKKKTAIEQPKNNIIIMEFTQQVLTMDRQKLNKDSRVQLTIWHYQNSRSSVYPFIKWHAVQVVLGNGPLSSLSFEGVIVKWILEI